MVKMIRQWNEEDMNGRKSIWQVGEKFYFISSVKDNFWISETMAFECDKDENILSWHEKWAGKYETDHYNVAKELAA